MTTVLTVGRLVARRPQVKGFAIAKRGLGDSVSGPPITDVAANLRFAKEFFTKHPRSYPEFKQQCISLRMFAFAGVTTGCVLSLMIDPPKSSYWVRWGPTYWFSHVRELFSSSSPPLFLRERLDNSVDAHSLVGLTSDELAAMPIAKAVCQVSPQGKACPGSGPAQGHCTGTVTFTQLAPKVCKIEYDISGMKPGLHGFHVHEKADFSKGCDSAGPHFNPYKKTHGAPWDEERHVGDMGNICANSEGVAKGVLYDHLIKIVGPAEYSVVGRSVMVHADEDDLGRGDNSQPGPPPVNGKASKATGNAGARIACGKIDLA